MVRALAAAIAVPLLAACAPSDPPDAPTGAGSFEATAPDTTAAVPAAPPRSALGDTSWTTEPTELAGADGVARLVGVRWASHAAEGFDRVVFEFDGPLPGVRVASPDGPARRCGSGEPVATSGASVWEVRMQPAAAHDEAGQATAPHDRQRVGSPALRDLVPTCDFEGDVTWALGVAEGASYRVLRLTNPARVVVDVRRPGEAEGRR